jgi:hypothetical protein
MEFFRLTIDRSHPAVVFFRSYVNALLESDFSKDIGTPLKQVATNLLKGVLQKLSCNRSVCGIAITHKCTGAAIIPAAAWGPGTFTYIPYIYAGCNQLFFTVVGIITCLRAHIS